MYMYMYICICIYVYVYMHTMLINGLADDCNALGLGCCFGKHGLRFPFCFQYLFIFFGLCFVFDFDKFTF